MVRRCVVLATRGVGFELSVPVPVSVEVLVEAGGLLMSKRSRPARWKSPSLPGNLNLEYVSDGVVRGRRPGGDLVTQQKPQGEAVPTGAAMERATFHQHL
jgi:hypothetical protein